MSRDNIFEVLRTATISVLIPLMGWMALSINALSVSVAGLESTVKERTMDRYTSKDAAKDFGTIHVMIANLERRLGSIETTKR